MIFIISHKERDVFSDIKTGADGNFVEISIYTSTYILAFPLVLSSK